jgi:hypothetical protein
VIDILTGRATEPVPVRRTQQQRGRQP